MIDFNVLECFSVEKEIETSGHRPLVVLGNDFKKYIIKNDKGVLPPISLINEALSVFFLSKWKIKTANSTFMNVDKSLLDDKLSTLYHKEHFYNIPCFASEIILESVDVSEIVSTLANKLYDRVNNNRDLFRIALFDLWLENDDRKQSNYNLILKPELKKYRIIPIDHAFMFSSLGYSYLNYSSYSPIANAHLLDSELGIIFKSKCKIDREFIEEEQLYFYLCVSKCEESFDDFFLRLSEIYELDVESKQKIKEFIFNKERNKKIFEEYVCRLEL